MEFIAMHFDGPDKEIEDTGYGTGLAVHHNDLKAKKAWFCFDREAVMLGSGISSSMSSQVRTTVEHRRLASDSDILTVRVSDGSILKTPAAPFSYSCDSPGYVMLDSHAAFVFGEGSRVSVERYVCDEAGGQSYFEIDIDHGIDPCNESYEYAILPYATADELESYLSAPSYRVISNTPRVQAVAKDSLGYRCFVFYAPDSCDGVTVDSPMLLTVSKSGEAVRLMVCDPTHKLSEMKVSLKGEYLPLSESAAYSFSEDGEKCTVTFRVEGAHGRTLIAELKENKKD